jgi:rhodanese-related sulfurtransferase
VCCAAGNRSQSALRKLDAAGYSRIAHVGGGIAAWKACGLPVVEDRSARISLMRQMQFIAGTLVFAGTLLGVIVSPWLLLIPGCVGAGLMFAGASGSCRMAQLLAKLPYNQSAARSTTGSSPQRTA